MNAVLLDSQVSLLSSGEEDCLPSLTTLMASAEKLESQTTSIQQHLSSNKFDCGICLSNKIDVMFYKCGHIYCCENCAFKLNGTCPICRQKYDEIVKIYLR